MMMLTFVEVEVEVEAAPVGEEVRITYISFVGLVHCSGS